MLPDRVSNPGLLSYESAALPIALRSPAEWELSLFCGGGGGGERERGEGVFWGFFIVDISIHTFPLFLFFFLHLSQRAVKSKTTSLLAMQRE